jgi:DNA-binding MarR family transcriptional regulator
LSVLTNQVSSAIAGHYSERFDLSIPEWRIIAVLGENAGLSARDVATRTAMDKVQVSRAVASLLKVQRIQRSSDAKDGRITHLSLTRAGRKIYQDIAPFAHEADAAIPEVTELDPGG